VANGLKATEPEERVKTLRKLAEFGPDAAVVGEMVIDVLIDKNDVVREVAKATLLAIHPKAGPHIYEILYGKKKREALQALAELGSEAKLAVPLLLRCNDNVELWGGGNPRAGILYEDLLPIIAKIAPHDKRFAAMVLNYIAEPNKRNSHNLRVKRAAALAQLPVINATAAEKVAALTAALEDGELALDVIKTLETFGADAKPALPALKNLKSSLKKEIRNAAIAAIATIETAAAQ
jgi:HEAT repeat protein